MKWHLVARVDEFNPHKAVKYLSSVLSMNANMDVGKSIWNNMIK